MGLQWLGVVLLIFVSCVLDVQGGTLRVGYYNKSCRRAEAIIRSTVREYLAFAPSLLRMHFHDCFVNGCDGSILLDGEGVEKNALPNLSLRGFEVIDEIKTRLEKMCPKTVSCADILAYVARDSSVLTGAKFWQVPGGRKDGFLSRVEDVLQNLPPPSFNVSQLIENFAQHDLSAEDMVILSGGHTLGVSHCISFVNRLYNFSEETPLDPSMARGYARKLMRVCPSTGISNETVFPLDYSSPRRFNNNYYRALNQHRGLLFSDQVLHEDDSTRDLVLAFSQNNALFLFKFKEAMIRMSSIGVLTGEEGEVRVNCRFPNAYPVLS